MCGTVHELSKNKNLTYGSKCSQCEHVLEPYPERKITEVSISSKITLASIPFRGLGVVATAAISRGEMIERCPVLVIQGDRDSEGYKEMLKLDVFPYPEAKKSIKLQHLLLPWPDGDHRAIGVGYAMMYNHEPDQKANAFYVTFVDPDSGRRYLDFYAKKNIKAGEEICQTYNDDNYLWFKPKHGG
jgi:hypothetical protein